MWPALASTLTTAAASCHHQSVPSLHHCQCYDNYQSERRITDANFRRQHMQQKLVEAAHAKANEREGK